MTSEIKNIHSNAVYSGDDGLMTLTVNSDGSVYGVANHFDFERKTAMEAAEQLAAWGYEFIGTE